jgi:hypothetical protein
MKGTYALLVDNSEHKHNTAVVHAVKVWLLREASSNESRAQNIYLVCVSQLASALRQLRFWAVVEKDRFESSLWLSFVVAFLSLSRKPPEQ